MLDLLIKNGRLVSGEPIEIGIVNKKIVAVSSVLSEESAKVIDLKGDSYVSPGWIDSHVHCFEKMDLYYDFPDQIGVKKGVTTVVDAGSTGAKNIGEFYQLAQVAATNVLALINISDYGIVTQDELADLSKINEDSVKEALERYQDFIIGLKVRMSKTVIGDNGIIPLEIAKKIQKDNGNIPLMVHIGSAPPELSDILTRLDQGDIVTHCFNGKTNGILADDESIKKFVWDAYRQGIIFDIGHGTDSFNFHVAEVALKEKMIAGSISTDIYHRNRETGPVHDLATTMEKFLEIGYSLPDIIEKVTLTPATYFHLETKGRLEVGADGDLTIFNLRSAEKELTDSNGNKRLATKQIVPVYAVVGGEVYDVD